MTEHEPLYREGRCQQFGTAERCFNCLPQLSHLCPKGPKP